MAVTGPEVVSHLVAACPECADNDGYNNAKENTGYHCPWCHCWWSPAPDGGLFTVPVGNLWQELKAYFGRPRGKTCPVCLVDA